MKKTFSTAVQKIMMLASLFIFTIISCGKSGPLEFIPNLSNTWTNKADATNTFFFFPAQDNTNKTTFTGNANPPGGAPQVQFSGSFENVDIEFTYTSGAQSGKRYTGKFVRDSNPLRMELTSGAESLVLERN